MNDEFLTEEQEAEKARQWVRENGLYIVAGVVLGLGGLFGWQAWEDGQVKTSGDASIVWEQLRSAADGQRYNEVDEVLTVLETDYADTPYLDQARLMVARIRVEQNDPVAAIEQLELVANAGRDAQLRRLAELRTAQIQISEGEYDTALAVLGESESTALAGLYHELRGDAFHGSGDFAAAVDEYQAALDADTMGGIDRSFVQIKLDDASSAASAQLAATDAG